MFLYQISFNIFSFPGSWTRCKYLIRDAMPCKQPCCEIEKHANISNAFAAISLIKTGPELPALPLSLSLPLSYTPDMQPLICFCHLTEAKWRRSHWRHAMRHKVIRLCVCVCATRRDRIRRCCIYCNKTTTSEQSNNRTIEVDPNHNRSNNSQKIDEQKGG